MPLTRSYKPWPYKKASKSKKKGPPKGKEKMLMELLEKSPKLQEMILKRANILAESLADKKIAQQQIRRQKAEAYRPGMGKEFYWTPEWRKLRYGVIERNREANGELTCECCRATEGRMDVDHIMPRSKFPRLELDPSNLQVLCEACNMGKSNQFNTDWRR